MPKKTPAIPRLHEITAVVFDLDGVLVDSEPVHFRATNRVFARYGAAISEAEYRTYIGMGEAESWEAWRRRYGLAASVAELSAAIRPARVEEIAAGVPAIDDAVQLARQLHGAGTPLAIASSSTPEVIDALLAALGPVARLRPEASGGRAGVGSARRSPLGGSRAAKSEARQGVGDLFGVRVSGQEVRHSKPAPDVSLLAASRLGVAPVACLAIEDSAHGVTAAKRAGMTCIAVPNRWTADQDFREADVVLESLRHFPLLLL